jgi:hypothetical protein
MELEFQNTGVVSEIRVAGQSRVPPPAQISASTIGAAMPLRDNCLLFFVQFE